MSTVQKNQQVWPIVNSTQDSKYEKCLNITEEIYKRINITFQIKKLETGSQSDISLNNSDQIDSNDLSNETDLFAYEKSTSISSSVSDVTTRNCDKYINLNNNEVARFKKTVPYLTAPRPKKRFRKRVKKRANKCTRSDTDCSSDEGLPLSRIVVDLNTTKSSEELDVVSSELPSKVQGIAKVIPKKVIKSRDACKETDVVSSNNKELQLKEESVQQNNVTDICNSMLTDEQNVNLKLSEATKSYPIIEVQPIDFSLKDNAKEIPVGNEETGPIGSKEKDVAQNMEGRMCRLCNMLFHGESGLKRHMITSHNKSNDISKKSSQKGLSH